jgi:tetratricopeptide (TPR) repeat protein
MKGTTSLCRLLLIVFGGAMSASAQGSMPGGDGTSPIVYIIDFGSADTTLKQQAADLNLFAVQMLQMKLAASGKINSTRVSVAPECGSEPPSSSSGFHPVIQLKLDGQKPFYIVRGSVELRDSAVIGSASDTAGEMVLNVELIKVENCNPQLIIRRSIPFRQSNALDTFDVTSDILVLRISDAIRNFVAIDVERVQNSSSSIDDIGVANALGDSLNLALQQTSTYTPQDLRKTSPDKKGDFSLKTSLTVIRKRTLPLFQSEISGLSIEFSILADGEVLWKGNRAIDLSQRSDVRSSDQLKAFYEDAANFALSGLDIARTARDASLHEDLATVPEGVLRTKVNEFLCIGTPPGCQSKPSSSLPLLVELTHRHSTDLDLLKLLGQTQEQAAHYMEAAQTFERTLTQVPDISHEVKIALLDQAGIAWYEFEDYGKAAEKFKDALIEIGPINGPLSENLISQQSDIRLNLARSTRFLGDRKAAFRDLLDSLPVVKNRQPFNRELRDLVASMQFDELVWAENEVGKHEDEGLDPNVRAIIHVQLAQVYLVSKYDSDNANKELLQAEAIPLVGLDQTVQATTSLWRGEWYRLKSQWGSAERFFANALTLEDSEIIRYRVALFYYQWALAELNSNEAQRSAHWRVAAKTVEPLFGRDSPDPSDDILRFADAILRNANHFSQNDEETRTFYQGVLEKQPNSSVVLAGLMGVCTDFLHDLACALDAAKRADRPDVPNSLGALLDIIEIYVQAGQYDLARKRIQSLQSRGNSGPQYYGAVAHFYQTWASLGAGDLAGATKSKEAWDNDIVTFRKNSSKSKDFLWRFDGTRAILAREQHVPSIYIETLKEMIDAMGDRDLPLPSLPR